MDVTHNGVTLAKKGFSGGVALAAKKEFYICFQPAPFLDGKYTVFGKVVSGMEVVDGIKVGDKMKSVKITEE